MIRLATFDLYQTLCYSDPSRLERIAAVCRALGHDCSAGDLLWPNVLAEELYTVENGRHALHLRSTVEQAAFYTEMFTLLLRTAGMPHDRETVHHVRRTLDAGRAGVRWRLFRDVLPTMAALRERGLAVGVISNTSVDATILCTELGVHECVDFVVSSCLVGCEKPGPHIFHTALGHAAVGPHEAVHIGDQPRSDAVGAVGVGMHALLLDRHGLLDAEREYERVASLADVIGWVDARNIAVAASPSGRGSPSSPSPSGRGLG